MSRLTKLGLENEWFGNRDLGGPPPSTAWYFGLASREAPSIDFNDFFCIVKIFVGSQGLDTFECFFCSSLNRKKCSKSNSSILLCCSGSRMEATQRHYGCSEHSELFFMDWFHFLNRQDRPGGTLYRLTSTDST